MKAEASVLLKIGFAAIVAVSLARQGGCAIIFSNFSNTPPGYVPDSFAISLTQGFFFGTTSNEWAMAFSVPAGPSYVLTGVDVPLTFPDGPGTVTFSLDVDTNGAPGLALDSFTFSGSASTPAIFAGTSTLNPILHGGTQYWLAGAISSSPVGTEVDWNASAHILPPVIPPPPTLTGFRQFPIPGTWSVRPGVQAAFSVSGTAIPEPGTGIFVGIAVLIGGLVSRRSRAR